MSPLDGLCWALIAAALVVDAVNGLFVLQLGLDAKLSLLFKGFLALTLSLNWLLRRPHQFLLVFVPLCIALLLRPLLVLADSEVGALTFDLPVALRILTLPLLLSFALRQATYSPSRYERLARSVLYLNFGTISVSVIAGLAGIGFPTYPSTGIGYKGFFVAGNEVSAVLITTAGFVLAVAWRERSAVAYWSLAAFASAISLLLATKAAVLASLVLAIAFPLLGSDTRRLSGSTLATLAAVIGVFVSATWLARDFILASALGQRVVFVYERVGLVDLLFSGRLEFLERYLMTLREGGTVVGVFFGFGSDGLLGSGPQSIEIDPVDVAVVFGLPFALALTTAAVASVTQTRPWTNHSPYSPAAFAVNCLLLFFAVTAGHVWTSGMLGVSWMLLNGLALQPSERGWRVTDHSPHTSPAT